MDVDLLAERHSLERDLAWHRNFNIKGALSTIARCIAEAGVLNEHLASARQELEAVEAEVSSVRLVSNGTFAGAWLSSQHAANKRTLQEVMARRQVLRARLEELEAKVRLVFNEAACIEAELERRRTFNAPDAVRRLLALEARQTRQQAVYPP